MEIIAPGTLSVPIADPTMVAEARRRVAAVALEQGFNETQLGRLAIATTELASNLLKHGGGGELYVVVAETSAGPAVDLLAVDRGRGMNDVDACLRDGYSTAGSPGTGLGALSRLSSIFDIHSIVGSGSVVHVRLFGRGEPRPDALPRLDIFGLCLPYPGLDIVGDSWAYRETRTGCVVMLVDGLGHGMPAAQASREAVESFRGAREDASPAELLEDIHHGLRATRGAVAGVARIDIEREELAFGGVGNISAMIVSGIGTKRLMSHNGTLGGSAQRFRQLTYAFSKGAMLVLSSDGLASSLDVMRFPGLSARSAPIVAGTLMREFRRERDDATVVAVRETTST